MNEFMNADGKTYNGIKMLAAISGLSEAEITWTWDRAKELKASGMDKEQMKSVLKAESKSKPWEK